MVPLGVPAMVVQGDRDLTVPAATTRTLVARMCANGDPVRRITYPSAGHSDVVIAADADVRRWIDDRLTGVAASSDC
jgi:dipeptidyl aminopeptidase/acylaminoacyl peptidase